MNCVGLKCRVELKSESRNGMEGSDIVVLHGRLHEDFIALLMFVRIGTEGIEDMRFRASVLKSRVAVRKFFRRMDGTENVVRRKEFRLRTFG